MKDASLITPEVLCRLIELNRYILIKEILQYKYFDIPFIIILLSDYRNKTKRTKREFQNIISLNKDKIKLNNKNEMGYYPR